MNATSSRKWPREITVGNVSVKIYKRFTPSGNRGYMVAYKQDGKRKFDSYTDQAQAILEANSLARKLSTVGVKAAQLTDDQLRACVMAMDELKPYGITITEAVSAIVEGVKITGDLPGVGAACRFYKLKHKSVTPMKVADVVAELIKVKEARGAAARYLGDLRFRLDKFGEAFQRNINNVTTPDIQAWLDGLKAASQSYMNFRRVAHLLFEFAVARGYAMDNPVSGVERVKIRNGEIEIFTPDEIERLLRAASPDFLPALAIGAFAGLRSAEIERLKWQDIDLKQGHIVVGADTAKTASRRIVPIAENLSAWLAPYAGSAGKVWRGLHDALYDAQQDTAKAAELKWKANACRHSFASYSFALCADAGRVAGYCGNSPAMIHKHYKQLCTPDDAKKFFSVKPAKSVNAIGLPELADATA